MGCCTSIAEGCGTAANRTKTTEGGATAAYSASVENQGGSTYQATTRHSTFLMGTAGRGANPVDTLLASLCGCIAHYAREYVRERDIPVERLTVKADGTATPDGARLARIDLRIDLHGIAPDERQRAGLLATAEKCKVHNTLKAACDVRVTVGSSG